MWRDLVNPVPNHTHMIDCKLQIVYNMALMHLYSLTHSHVHMFLLFCFVETYESHTILYFAVLDCISTLYY